MIKNGIGSMDRCMVLEIARRNAEELARRGVRGAFFLVEEARRFCEDHD